MGYVNIMEYNDADGSCELSIAELQAVCSDDMFQTCMDYLDSAGAGTCTQVGNGADGRGDGDILMCRDNDGSSVPCQDQAACLDRATSIGGGARARFDEHQAPPGGVGRDCDTNADCLAPGAAGGAAPYGSGCKDVPGHSGGKGHCVACTENEVADPAGGPVRERDGATRRTGCEARSGAGQRLPYTGTSQLGARKTCADGGADGAAFVCRGKSGYPPLANPERMECQGDECTPEECCKPTWQQTTCDTFTDLRGPFVNIVMPTDPITESACKFTASDTSSPPDGLGTVPGCDLNAPGMYECKEGTFSPHPTNICTDNPGVICTPP